MDTLFLPYYAQLLHCEHQISVIAMLYVNVEATRGEPEYYVVQRSAALQPDYVPDVVQKIPGGAMCLHACDTEQAVRSTSVRTRDELAWDVVSYFWVFLKALHAEGNDKQLYLVACGMSRELMLNLRHYVRIAAAILN